MSNTNCRNALLSEVARAKEVTANAVIWEITDLERGAPPGRVREMASVLRPFGRAVFASVDTACDTSHPAKLVSLAGQVFAVPADLAGADETVAWLHAIGRQARGRSPTLIAVNLASKALLAAASEAGFSHATVRI